MVERFHSLNGSALYVEDSHHDNFVVINWQHRRLSERQFSESRCIHAVTTKLESTCGFYMTESYSKCSTRTISGHGILTFTQARLQKMTRVAHCATRDSTGCALVRTTYENWKPISYTSYQDWRHDMEMISCMTGSLWGNPSVTDVFLSQRGNNAELSVFFVVSLNKMLD